MAGHRVDQAPAETALEIRIRGRVQGVGFRPTVWRMARELGLSGEVLNDGAGVLLRAGGPADVLAALICRIRSEPPPLARIDEIETVSFYGVLELPFRIAESGAGGAHTEITPDAAICEACAAEINDQLARRFRYPFTNCTHCGPRLSIITAIPYDRAHTTMSPFTMCNECAAEYADPADRRFHAEAIACPACGPQARLIRLDGSTVPGDLDTACSLLQKGEILAMKGIGGYQLVCDATQAGAVSRLRAKKRRDAKPFALMARDIDIIRQYCRVSGEETRLLASPAAPIVLLEKAGLRLPEQIAPGLTTLGFMLPTTPLHALILRRMNGPVVMTSGNISGAPQIIDDAEMLARLAGVADCALVHDRAIANRVDDSVMRMMAGQPRLLRRARGFAPAPVRLPPGFENAPEALAMGGELKATFCMVKDGNAILSQHQGDLEDATTFDDYGKNLALYAEIFGHTPAAIITDLHGGYQSAKRGRALAGAAGIPLLKIQHHHAHIAACLVENGRPLAAGPVLGIVLDGAGLGDDGTFWGGEFLRADYRSYQRLGTLKPVALPGGEAAMREPWRNLYAHLLTAVGWQEFSANFSDLALFADLTGRPRQALDVMIAKNINSPLASSCGRLFDAVAAALNLCRPRQDYEGEAAARLEALVDLPALRCEDAFAYPFDLAGAELPYIEPAPMWRALLGDLRLGVPPPVIAARFHTGLARTIAAMAVVLAGQDAPRFDTIALSGGCFQNRILFEALIPRLAAAGFSVLTHAKIPANDGGLALGQAAIGAARLIGQYDQMGETR